MSKVISHWVSVVVFQLISLGLGLRGSQPKLHDNREEHERAKIKENYVFFSAKRKKKTISTWSDHFAHPEVVAVYIYICIYTHVVQGKIVWAPTY